MYFVYVLINGSTGELYYGYTGNLKKRMSEHGNAWELIYYEAYLSESDARNREKKLKHYGQARFHLKGRIKDSLGLKLVLG